MSKISVDKKFWVGELTFQFTDKEITKFILLDCETKDEARKKLYSYAEEMWSDNDDRAEDEEGNYNDLEEPKERDDGCYSFDDGNVQLFADLIRDQMTVTEYIEYKGGQIIF